MKAFLDSLKALGVGRLLGILGVGVAVLGIVGFVAMRGTTQPMALLYSDLELRDSAEVAAALDKLHVAYELKDNGSMILAPADQVDRLRLSLARDNLPGGGSVGYEVFDRNDSLTSNQFQQQINQLRALEGELGRTIRSIRGVRAARVHLVLAKREPFAREQQEAQASIVLGMAGAARMGDGEVQAIVNLVASAVPGLKGQNVSVVDNRGELLARSGRPNGQGVGQGGPGDGNDDVRRAMEQRLGQTVEDMLARTLGPGRVRAEASVEMDFERVNETQERFDPQGQVPRSTQTVSDASKSSEPPAGVSVQNNLPNPDPQAAAGAAGSASNRQEENTTFEIGKTVRTLVHDSPSIKRLSIAVLVDGVTAKGADGQVAWHEMAKDDLDRIGLLVKSAVGYDDKRGDRVDVVSMRFSVPEQLADAEPAHLGWLQLGHADLLWLATLGAIVLVALFALGFVVRPMALKLALRLPALAPGLGALGGLALLEAPALLPAANAIRPVAGGPVAGGALAGGALAGLPGGLQAGDADDTMLNVAHVQGEVRAASIRNLAALVDAQPEASVTVIRGWLGQGAG